MIIAYKISPQQYAVILNRILTDMVTRFHMPYAVDLHPGNWVKFSRVQGEELLRQAAEHRLPVWSFDQWLTFWEVRDSWRLGQVLWDGTELKFTAQGKPADGSLCLALPEQFAGLSLSKVVLDQQNIAWKQVSRYRENIALLEIPTGETAVSVQLKYQ